MPGLSPLRVVDAHHHLWDPSSTRYGWMHAGVVKFMGETAAVCTPYEVEDFQGEAWSVELIGSVHLQCGRNPHDPVEETEWVQRQADRSGLPIAIVGYANLADPQLDTLLQRHAQSAGFRGVRQMLNWGDQEKFRLCDRGDYLSDATWQRGFARLGERGLSFDLQVNPWQLAEAARVVERHPGTLVIVNHAGLPFDLQGEKLRQWQDGMRRMADHPGTSVKFSGLGMVDPHWSPASVRPIFDFLIEHFGPDRMMFGSNFPIDRLYKPYDQVFLAYRELCNGLGPSAAQALLHGTAKRVYRIDDRGSRQ